jgi:hypothetical protein
MLVIYLNIATGRTEIFAGRLRSVDRVLHIPALYIVVIY